MSKYRWTHGRELIRVLCVPNVWVPVRSERDDKEREKILYRMPQFVEVIKPGDEFVPTKQDLLCCGDHIEKITEEED